MLNIIPNTLPLQPFVPQISSISANASTEPNAEHLPYIVTLRDGNTPLGDLYVKCIASRKHTLQDSALWSPLPLGTLLFSVGDATTNAKGVAPEDAMEFVLQSLNEEIFESAKKGFIPRPGMLIPKLNSALSSWLSLQSGAVCGVAQSIAMLNGDGTLQVASVGDTRALLYKPKRFLSPSSLRCLNNISKPTIERRLVKSYF
jgi:hypothetical protein